MPAGNAPRGIAAPRRSRLRDATCRVVTALEAEPCDCQLRVEEGLPLSDAMGAGAVGGGIAYHEFRAALGEGTCGQRLHWDREAEDGKARLKEKASGPGRPQLKPLNLPPRQQLLATVFGSSACIHTYRPHVLGVEDWAALLRLWDERGYADRPLGAPRRVATRAGRVALYRLRVSRGESVFHPGDLDIGKEEGIEVMGAKGKAELAGKEGVVQR